MTLAPETLEELEQKSLAELAAIADLKDLDAWRVRVLGKKGELTQLLRAVGGLPPEERPAFGAAANRVKARIEAAYFAREAALKEAAIADSLTRERIDVTLPGRPPDLGRLHPTTQVLREILAAFGAMGFQVVEGPEVE